MEELIQKLQNVHGLSAEQSHKILGTIADYLKEKFPMVGGAIDNLFQSGTTPSGPGTTPLDVQSHVADPMNDNSDLIDKISQFIPGVDQQNMEEIAKKYEGGQVNFKTEAKSPLMHLTVGKMSFGKEKLTQNVESLITAVKKANIRNATLKSTMSPGIKIKI